LSSALSRLIFLASLDEGAEGGIPLEWFMAAAGILGIFGTLFILDRLATWMESQGWIYWRKSKGGTTRMGSAFLGIQEMFDPGKKHIIEARFEIKRKKRDSGDSSSPVKNLPPRP
jgi:hypothetical protein